MSATRPDRRPLEGRFVRLEPLATEHLPGLWTALGRPEVFAGGFGGGPAGLPVDERAFAEWVWRTVPHEAGITYVARSVSGADEGVVIGMSSLADFDLVNGHAHIGWTGFDPRVWGGPVNPECKLLMLATAFEHGFVRVKLQADVLNARSRAAILKLGAQFEGITRRDRLRADGSIRDTAVYAVILEDWPGVRAGLETRLAAADRAAAAE